MNTSTKEHFIIYWLQCVESNCYQAQIVKAFCGHFYLYFKNFVPKGLSMFIAGYDEDFEETNLYKKLKNYHSGVYEVKLDFDVISKKDSKDIKLVYENVRIKPITIFNNLEGEYDKKYC